MTNPASRSNVKIVFKSGLSRALSKRIPLKTRAFVIGKLRNQTSDLSIPDYIKLGYIDLKGYGRMQFPYKTGSTK